MTTEEKFRAAVNVIRSLPKNGSYQPSADLMLRFYAYYKQATEGPCKGSRPAFWEVIKKAKWDAWNRLGNMSKEEAMENYVEELKKIVETMSYTENVAQFLESLDSFYERVPQEDLNMLVGNIVERVVGGSGESSPIRPSSPNGSPSRAVAALAARFGSSLETSPASSCSSPSPRPPASDTEDEEEEFIDTIEEGLSASVILNGNHPSEGTKRSSIHSPSKVIYKEQVLENGLDANHNHPYVPSSMQLHSVQIAEKHVLVGEGLISDNPKHTIIPNGDVPCAESGLTNGKISHINGYTEPNPKHSSVNSVCEVDVPVNESPVSMVLGDQTAMLHIKQLVLNLQDDLDVIKTRLRSLEKLSSAKALRANGSVVPYMKGKIPAWWPFPELSPRTAAFLLLWPFAAHLLIGYLSRRPRSRC